MGGQGREERPEPVNSCEINAIALRGAIYPVINSHVASSKDIELIEIMALAYFPATTCCILEHPKDGSCVLSVLYLLSSIRRYCKRPLLKSIALSYHSIWGLKTIEISSTSSFRGSRLMCFCSEFYCLLDSTRIRFANSEIFPRSPLSPEAIPRR